MTMEATMPSRGPEQTIIEDSAFGCMQCARTKAGRATARAAWIDVLRRKTETGHSEGVLVATLERSVVSELKHA